MSAETYGKELEAFDAAVKQRERLGLTAPVDDDFPEILFAYDMAIARLVIAMRENGRFPQDNKMGVVPLYTDLTHIALVNVARAQRWHPKGLESWSLSDWAVALAGETGELCNVVKKLNRDRDELIGNKESVAELWAQLKAEAADVLLYLVLFAERASFSLTDAVREKFNQTSEKFGFPERL